MARFVALIAGVLIAWAAASAGAAPLTVFAAASLRNALDEVVAAYAAQHPPPPVVSYAASSALARQIENGSPADVFISADVDWMDELERKGLVAPGTRRNLLRNRLVLVAPADHPQKLEPVPGFALADALHGGRLALADPAFVPAGKYARAALEKLGVWPQVAHRVAAAENVRAALALVARGEAPLGIVYATDAREEPRVMVAGTFPADSHPPIIYPAAALTGASDDAAAFLQYLHGDAARRIFERHGFDVN
jgi:molybdate transport system substrate-binding protein